MKILKIETEVDVFDTLEETSSDVQELMEAAIEARKNAYAPYSKFSVGAAILLDNGEVVTGNNQENASYPSGLCAERTAVYYAASKFPQNKIQSIAISAGSLLKTTLNPVAPCGACRQAIAEYEIKQDSPIEIYFMGETGKVVRSKSLSNLLPLIFDGSNL
ncbi:MAG: cytidine deaminase [Flavobacteriaceae bacterium]|nr:cytidine deaminase [Flavobacteriaceae bacterium]